MLAVETRLDICMVTAPTYETPGLIQLTQL